MTRVANQEKLIAPFALYVAEHETVPKTVTRQMILDASGEIPDTFKAQSCDLSLFDDAQHNFPSGGGSENIPWLKNSVRLYDNSRRERALSELNWVYNQSTFGYWMQREPFSRIYASWHLIGCLIAYRWAHKTPNAPQWMKDFTEGWMINFWKLCAITAVQLPSGAYQTTFCGSRSGERDLEPQMYDMAFTIAMGSPLSGFPAYYKKTWEGRALLAMSQVIRDSFAPVSGYVNNLPALVSLAPNWGAMVELNTVRTSGGVVSWMGDDDPATDDEGNNNTGPLAAFKILYNGVRESLPTNGGIRIRSQQTIVSCWRTSGYGGNTFDPNGKWLCMFHSVEGTHWMEFPPGAQTFAAELKPTGWQIMGATGPSQPPVTNPPDPTPTPPPNSNDPDFPAELLWLKDTHEWLLQLPEENLIVKKIWGDGNKWPLRYLVYRPK